MKTYTFGRKISYIPLLIGLLVGLGVSAFFYLISKRIGISIIFGCLSLMVVISLYMLNLVNLYGYWQINEQQIKYYDYASNKKKLKAILLPFRTSEKKFNLNQVMSITLIMGKKIRVPENIKAAPVSAYLVTYYPSIYYLNFGLENNQQLNLDLSYDKKNQVKIDEMLNGLQSVTNCEVTLKSS